MKSESGIEVLLPSVAYGNLKLFAKVTLDTTNDAGRIADAAQRFGLRGEGNSAEVVNAVTRKLCIEEMKHMKREVDKAFGKEAYTLEQFTK